MTRKDYNMVSEAITNFYELDKLISEFNTVEESKDGVKSLGYRISDEEIGRYSIRYENIETYVYEYKGKVVADPYINIYDTNGEGVIESMYIEDLENGIYEGIY